MSTTAKRHGKLIVLTELAMLIAIEAIVCFTPLGSIIAFGPIVATLSAIPVVISAVLLGTGAGAFMGFLFGLFSFIVWTFTPPSPIAFVFTPFYSLGELNGNILSLVICFVPRILIGVVAGVVASLFKKRGLNAKAGGITAAVLGSLTNTFLVLGGIYLFFGREYANAIGSSYDLLLGIIGASILTNGIPEAIVAGVFGGITPVLKKRISSIG